MKSNLFLILVLGTVLFSSCAKKTDDGPGGTTTTTHPDGYNITGSGFNNASYYITGTPSQAVSSLSSGVTTIAIVGGFGDTTTIRFDINITGNNAATYQLGIPPGAANSLEITTWPVSNPNNQTIYNSQPGSSLTITSYGAVGSAVTGTFTGKFQSVVGNNFTVSNGTFTATRVN